MTTQSTSPETAAATFPYAHLMDPTALRDYEQAGQLSTDEVLEQVLAEGGYTPDRPYYTRHDLVRAVRLGVALARNGNKQANDGMNQTNEGDN